LFFEDFSLHNFIQHFIRNIKPTNGNLIPVYVLSNHDEVSKRGIVELDKNGQVINFLEKPKPEETISNCAVPPLYLFSRATLTDLKFFVREFTQTRDQRDAPGMFTAWLYNKSPVYSIQICGRFDVGGLQDYIKADQHFSRVNS